MSDKPPPRRSGVGKIVRSILTSIGLLAIVVLLLLWLSGVFARKIDATVVRSAVGGERPVAADTRLVPASLVRMPAVESAVGTIRAVHETAVASKLLARVVEVNVQAGQSVQGGQVLIRLDDQDLRAQLGQAQAMVAAARAASDQARVEFDRVSRLYEQAAASKTEFDQVTTALKTALAELERAEHARAQAQTVLEYATIRSPIDGRVIDKLVEVGDTARPGQVLLTLYDPTRMQLVASVRESLTQRLAVGQIIGVHIDSLDRTCEGTVSEIVPEAESASRTFAVKVTGPCPPGVYSGMFGRLLIPLDEQEVLLIPQAAVRRVGQLDLVDVAEPTGPDDGKLVLRRRIVQLGRSFGDQVEVLSGLQAGQKVALVEPGQVAVPEPDQGP